MEADIDLPARHAEVLPPLVDIERARASLISSLPTQGIGVDRISTHLKEEIQPGLNRPSQSANYYGFVIGGTTAPALLGDNIASSSDQNVHVHLPKETIATEVEDSALRMVCGLLNLSPDEWTHRTFTTGATASNIVGLACGREFVLAKAGSKHASVAENGIHEAMRIADVKEMRILTTVPHSSLRKAASLVGIGRLAVKDVGLRRSPHKFNMEALKAALSERCTANIVSVSCAEVNTGLFATTLDEMRQIRALCDQHGAWLHVDAAFGLLARALPNLKEYEAIVEGVKGLELADSIAGDAHKLLNVPYDCGIFLSRHLTLGTKVFQNTNAAYLDVAAAAGPGEHIVPSPLNIGIENSRRFRALPVYATLAAYGHDGYSEMLQRQIRLARAIARFIDKSEAYELLPKGTVEENIYIIVLFRAKGEDLNNELVQRINSTRRIYVSGTQWDGKPAARFAVASWQVQVESDLALVAEILSGVAR